LIRKTNDNIINLVENWDQHQQLLQEFQQEEQHAQQLQGQNQQL